MAGGGGGQPQQHRLQTAGSRCRTAAAVVIPSTKPLQLAWFRSGHGHPRRRRCSRPCGVAPLEPPPSATDWPYGGSGAYTRRARGVPHSASAPQPAALLACTMHGRVAASPPPPAPTPNPPLLASFPARPSPATCSVRGTPTFLTCAAATAAARWEVAARRHALRQETCALSVAVPAAFGA